MTPKQLDKARARYDKVPKLTKKQIANLRDRMKRHTEVNDIAVVVLTALELQQLLDIADKTIKR